MLDYQMEYEGLTFGAGTGIGIEQIGGFEDFDVTQGDARIPRSWGDVPGLHTVNAREVTLQLTTTTEADFQDILTVFNPTEIPTELFLREPVFGTKFVYARPIGRSFVRNPVHKFKKMVLVRLKLADPRLYGDELYSQSLAIYNPSGGGLDYDVDYGKEYVGGLTNDKIFNNAGNADAYPLIRFYGPTGGTVTAVKLTNLTTSQTLDIASTLLNGQILSADMRRIVTVAADGDPYIHLGGSSRYGDWALPREAFYFAPGDNVIRYEITGTSTNAPCVINHRDTWL